MVKGGEEDRAPWGPLMRDADEMRGSGDLDGGDGWMEGRREPGVLEAHHWLEGGVAILDSGGRVIAVNPAMGAWMGRGLREAGAELDAAEAGWDFWESLGRRCPSWRKELKEMAGAGEVFVQRDLSLESEEESGGWFRLEIARHPSGLHVRLSSILPPASELPEAGWGAHLRGEAAGREMFVRLLRVETQLEKLAQHWPGVIYSQRPDYSFVFVSGRVEELTGLSIEDWRAQPRRFWDVVHEADAVELQHQFSQAAQQGQPLTTTFRVRNVVSGRVSYVLEHRKPVVSRGGLVLGYEGVWLDVTRQTLAEKLLTSAAWKETLAVVTMGLAHDFSNVMAGIHSLSESFHSQLEEAHPFWEGLGLIKKSALQASQLVHRIVNLHLGKPGERNYYDLNQIVSELLELVRKVIPRRIEVTSVLSEESLPVYVDAFEFRQVMINLALNASDAMPERGKLVFRTSRLNQAPPAARLQGRINRFPCGVLSVEDNGCGIKPLHLDLIFDPFFTTKSGSKGSGLGLYNARLFAEKHHGAIGVESVEGRGSTFHVCLPEAEFSETERGPAEPVRRRERLGILLCGPAGALLDAEAERLRTDGYHVATADEPNRVAEILTARDYVYHGVLLLVASGNLPLELHFAAWRRVCPGLRVILRPFGRDQDELDAELVRLADLVLTPELSQPEMLATLRQTLTH